MRKMNRKLEMIPKKKKKILRILKIEKIKLKLLSHRIISLISQFPTESRVIKRLIALTSQLEESALGLRVNLMSMKKIRLNKKMETFLTTKTKEVEEITMMIDIKTLGLIARESLEVVKEISGNTIGGPQTTLRTEEKVLI